MPVRVLITSAHFRLAPSTPRIEETGSGFWPTPKALPSGPDYNRMNRKGSGGDDLATAVAALFPTPAAANYWTGYGDTEACLTRMAQSRGKPLVALRLVYEMGRAMLLAEAGRCEDAA